MNVYRNFFLLTIYLVFTISSTTLNEKTIIHYDDLYQSHLSWITSSQQTGDPRLCWEVQVTYLRGDNDNFSCSLEKKIGTKEARKSNIVEININHIDFEGRASWGINVRKNASDVDEYGNVHGVAKLARVIAVKVLGKERRGAWSDYQTLLSNFYYCSLSLTGKYFPLANAAIRAFIDLGIHVTVAAGNYFGENSCYSSIFTSFNT
ncbi:hypothetical protein RhiirA4_540187 [Rhizophagus irregularis]|uniref:Peptidase S8/S53 domain-containing protein n=1 Tax=Rhizophagus irregularis TaxID=588596 RepID=A0A2I1G6A0_9GLOM|nr:hypothetical protein RhiirA4_540187 [Rhizophagus irregularis]